MRIVSYNIRKSVGLDWKRKPERILAVLEEMQPDIVVGQEVDKRLGSRQGTLPLGMLTSDLKYRFADVATRVKSHGWHGNAILFRPDVVVTEVERIELPSLEPRGAVSVFFETASGQKFHVVGVHLALHRIMRVKQALAILKYLKRCPRIPTIIAGDFNEWRKLGAASRIFAPTLDVITPGPSFHTSLPTAPLDRFVVTSDVQVTNTGVHRSELSNRASDHLPIFMDFDLPKAE
ncbi:MULTISPECIES: endonuclease/exonuclease/phosphatase family protein [Halocynthiibacter]|uniref:Endonuclease/exonuclease/phosphatase family protein n=1 Tax=Halocynthiibacter halioticoli TaxID=2986804 RepID=A0AAE3J0U4_9RHOB|nr:MULTISPECIES: endonuclease/exonuclease/phosphatase family protein [Halocynthiibacter]MCV6825594.1 endonuclease/exonuclease/phosphatase family protein [Halocynthiibacter halioticoli]MCW4058595.1 endonuclease/exonuclease/phosphatase family protein [Halocynthiibacter sp. SDUM655004]